MTHRRPLIALAISGSLIVAACGSDDGAVGGGGGDTAEFCGLLNQEDPGDNPDVIAAEFDKLQAASPAELADDVATVAEASAAANALDDESTDEEVEAAIDQVSAAEEASDRIDTWIEQNCPDDL